MTGPTVSWLIQQSAKHRVWVGTSFLEVDGEHFCNTFVLTSPKGQVAGKVRKEVPASLETYFFKGEWYRSATFVWQRSTASFPACPPLRGQTVVLLQKQIAQPDLL
jgi:predicted amidohydrolase